MRPIDEITAIAVLAVLSGCTLSPPPHKTYTASIERIGEREEVWSYFSPVKGYKPLFCLYLRINDPIRADRNELLRVWALDLYAPGIHGQAGDTVSFLYLGDLPKRGEVDFESLTGYKVISGKGFPITGRDARVGHASCGTGGTPGPGMDHCIVR